ncbi:c-type cytochrome [Aliiruegeria lutimaris]|uniref:Cytochrome c, mono-and diheme variants n=1 Tax=Aliiruegeria lutimaris TaxID=571298 RepID=A0A1G9MJF0_9RHOB|nr:cytochrome c [Aliiruegeria lutimaris]SDL74131.1 Cytochrome c, mono-and diheme variants [Aliiruegeria lutimaris]
MTLHLSIAAAALSSAAIAETTELRSLGEPVSPDQIQTGEALYAENCTSCHGENREGQPNWRRRLETGRMPAPPQDGTGHTYTHSDADLFAMTKFGIGAVVPGYESDMPAFEGVLADPEIPAILAFLKANWPEGKRRYQAALPSMTPLPDG